MTAGLIAPRDIVDAAFLQNVAYANSSDVLVNDLSNAGWTPVGADDLNLSRNLFGLGLFDSNYLFDNFNAQAFIASRGTTLAISFRGTEFSTDVPEVIADWFTNIIEGGLTGFESHYLKFRPLLNAFWQYFHANGFTSVIITGHSQGAAIADRFAIESAGESSFESVTFASPGNWTTTASVGNRIINFVHDGDIVPDLLHTNGLDLVVHLPGGTSIIGLHSSDTYLDTVRTIFGYYDQNGLHLTSVGQEVVDYISLTTAWIGSSSSDAIYGGSGRDAIFGKSGADNIFGGNDRDLIDGGDGSDDLRGEAGNDDLYGGTSFDFIYGGAGNDALYGGDSYDFLYGEVNDDLIYGGDGRDELWGGSENDRLYGGIDDDTVRGESGNDSLFGDGGQDVLVGGTGDDLIDGGDGVDRAVYAGTFTAANYQLTANANGTYTLRSLTNGEGVDTLVRVESLTFGNTTKLIGEWIGSGGGTPPPPPNPVDPTYIPPGSDPVSLTPTFNPLLSVTPINKQLTVGQSVSLIELFPASSWVDNDGGRDIVRFSVQDRTADGGYLTYDGQRVAPNTVYEMAIVDLAKWWFVAGSSAATDHIGFNIIQADGDFSPRLTTGAVVTTVAAVNPNPSVPDPVVIVGTDVARLDLDSRNGTSGDEGDNASYTIQRRGNQQGDIVVEWRIVGIGDHPADRRDFPAMSGTVTLYDGRGDRNFAIGITQDQIDEFDKQFRVELHILSGNAVFDDNSETYTIIDDDVPSGIDPNVDDHGNSFTTATVVAENQWARGFIEQAGDVDFFRFDLLGGVGYEFILYKDDDLSLIGGDPNAEYPTLPQPVVELYDGNGNFIANVPATNLSTRWAFRYDTVVDGSYYLRVSEGGNNDIGQYFVQADVRIQADDYSANISTIGQMTIDGMVQGTHERDNDDDWFGIDLVAGKTYRFCATSQERLLVDGSTGGVNGNNGWYFFGIDDHGFSIKDSNGATVAVRENGFPGYPTSGNLIEFTATISGTYYISVAGTDAILTHYAVSAHEVHLRPLDPKLILQPDSASVTDIRFSSIRDLASVAIDDSILTVNADTSSSIRFDLTQNSGTASYAAIEIFLFESAASVTGDLVVDVPGTRLTSSSVFGDIGTIEFVTAIPNLVVGRWVTIELTELYNQWINGERANNGIVLSTSEFSSFLMSFYSSNYTADPSLRPRLIVDGPDVISTPFGELSGSILEDDVSIDGLIGLTGTDVEFAGAAGAGTWGSIAVNSVGDTWTYTLGSNAQGLSQGEVVEDLITLTSSTGVSQVIRVVVTGQDDQTVVLGAGAFAMAEAVSVLNGASSLVDIDADVASTFAAGALVGTYGTFRMTVAGAWSYTLSNAGKIALGTGQAQTELFSVTATDGTVISFSVNLVGNDNDSLNYSTSVSGITVDGATGNDTIYGGAGNDLIYGGIGNDLLIGNLGNDRIDGGLGSDRAYFTGTTTATVNLSLLTAQVTGYGTDTLTGIEHLSSGSGNDRLTGDNFGNSLISGAGNDTVDGGAGNDALYGGDGNDLMFGGIGNDRIDGGLGSDRAYFNGTVAATVNLSLITAQVTGYGTDTLSGIEHISSGSGNDRLTGDLLDNSLLSGLGNDTVSGGAGNDTVDGGDGNDLMFGGIGNDRIDGGLGSDRAYFTGTVAATVNLSNLTAQVTGYGTDTLTGIEHLSSGSGNDTLIGDALGNSLVSGAGNDTVNGGAGNDALYGGAGNDLLTGGAGNDRFSYAAQTEAGDRVSDFIAADDSFVFQAIGFNVFQAGSFSNLAVGALIVASFRIGSTNVAADSNDFFIFRNTDHTLWFDADGNGTQRSAILIADLQTGATMTAADVLLI